MDRRPLQALLRQVRRLAGAGQPCGLTDGQLLERFVHERDEAAFEALLGRHGPLVLSACRRLLTRPQDVEDAFQATFLVLASKAGAIRRREALAGWLYRVAFRIALRVREEAAGRAAHERSGVEDLAAADTPVADGGELRAVLDEEVSQLPERYRTAFVLCYLQGKTNEQAARELGRPVGTILSRLNWARQRLRSRLTRRGVALSVAGFAVVGGEASAAVPAALVETTCGAAKSFAVSQAAGTVPAHAAALAKGVLKTMFLAKMRMTVLAVAALGLLIGGAGLALKGPGSETASAATHSAAFGPVAEPEERDRDLAVPARLNGVLDVIGTEVKEGERVPPERLVTVKVGGEDKKFRRLKEGDAVEKGQLLARLDDSLARDDVTIHEQKVIAAQANLNAAQKTYEEARERCVTLEKLAAVGGGAVSAEDLRGARLTKERYEQETIGQKANLEVARTQLNQAKIRLKMHEVRSPVAGVIKSICKRPGEAVRDLETVVRIKANEEP